MAKPSLSSSISKRINIYIPCSQNSCDLSVIPDECGRAVTVVIDNVNAIDSDELRSEIKELCRRKKDLGDNTWTKHDAKLAV